MPALPLADAGDHDAIASALERVGACLLRGLPGRDLLAGLQAELRALREAGALRPASVGRQAGMRQDASVRGDSTLWLDDPRCGAHAAALLASLDMLRAALDRRLFLGLRSTEAHFAAYPPGTGYARHRDRFRESDARVVSLVCYLNDDWQPRHGGALRLHLGEEPVDIVPAGGTGVCFLSELEHEVLPATRERLSVAAWMRRDMP